MKFPIKMAVFSICYFMLVITSEPAAADSGYPCRSFDSSLEKLRASIHHFGAATLQRVKQNPQIRLPIQNYTDFEVIKVNISKDSLVQRLEIVLDGSAGEPTDISLKIRSKAGEQLFGEQLAGYDPETGRYIFLLELPVELLPDYQIQINHSIM